MPVYTSDETSLRLLLVNARSSVEKIIIVRDCLWAEHHMVLNYGCCKGFETFLINQLSLNADDMIDSEYDCGTLYGWMVLEKCQVFFPERGSL